MALTLKVYAYTDGDGRIENRDRDRKNKPVQLTTHQ